MIAAILTVAIAWTIALGLLDPERCRFRLPRIR
jgi:hypothetical protein